MGKKKAKAKKQDGPKPLNARQARFVEEYMIDNVAKAAAIRAGYAETTADKQAAFWVGQNRSKCPPKYHHVWDAVQVAREERSKRTLVTADRVVRELALIAFVDPADLFDEFGRLKNIHDMPEDVRRAIAGVEVKDIFTKDGDLAATEYKVKKDCKVAALQLLARHLGMLNDKVTVNDETPRPPSLAVIIEKGRA